MKYKRQRGIVLVLTLVLLVVLTLFVLSSTRLSTGNLRIVGNMQAKRAVEAAAQYGVEQVLSDLTAFTPPPNAAAAYTVTAPPGVTGMTLTVSPRTCIRTSPAYGFSAVAPVAFEDTYWDVKVTVTDAITGSNTTVDQGTRIRLVKGNCP